MKTINMLAKNEDAFISSLWKTPLGESIDKLTDIMLYFSRNKTYMEARTEWFPLLEYTSPRPRVCICGRENNKTLYIRNIFTDVILRIGKECVYRFNFGDNVPRQVESNFVPLENICVECKSAHVGNGIALSKNLCENCYKKQCPEIPPFPLEDFLFRLPTPPTSKPLNPNCAPFTLDNFTATQAVQGTSPKTGEVRSSPVLKQVISYADTVKITGPSSLILREEKTPSVLAPSPILIPPKTNDGWQVYSSNRNNKVKRSSDSNLRCKDCGKNDGTMRSKDFFCYQCHKERKSREICIACGQQALTFKGVCHKCNKNKA